MNDDLRRQIEALHEELSKMGSVEPQSRHALLALLGDITRLLEDAPAAAAPSAALSGRLDEMAVQFEAEHPSLGAALRRVVDALGKAGI